MGCVCVYGQRRRGCRVGGEGLVCAKGRRLALVAFCYAREEGRKEGRGKAVCMREMRLGGVG